MAPGDAPDVNRAAIAVDAQVDERDLHPPEVLSERANAQNNAAILSQDPGEDRGEVSPSVKSRERAGGREVMMVG